MPLEDSSPVAGAPEDAPTEAVLVPVLNEAATIGAFLPELAAHSGNRRVYLLDSDSSDDTVAEARRAAAQAGLDLVVLRCPAGLSAAIRHGVEQSAEAHLAVIDGDGQHSPAVLGRLFQELGAGHDICVASRMAQGAAVAAEWPRHRRFFTKALWTAARLGGRCHGVKDPLSGCFAFRRTLWQRVAPRFATGGFKFLLDLLTVAPNPRVAEVPIAFRARQGGRSKVALHVFWELVNSLAWNVLRGRVPRRMVAFGTVGVSGSLADATVTGVLHSLLGVPFSAARPAGILAGMTNNFLLNNLVTFRDRRRKRWQLLRGWLLYAGFQSVGALTNYGVSITLNWLGLWWPLALLAGIAAGTTLNYLTASRMVWRGAPWSRAARDDRRTTGDGC